MRFDRDYIQWLYGREQAADPEYIARRAADHRTYSAKLASSGFAEGAMRGMAIAGALDAHAEWLRKESGSGRAAGTEGAAGAGAGVGVWIVVESTEQLTTAIDQHCGKSP